MSPAPRPSLRGAASSLSSSLKLNAPKEEESKTKTQIKAQPVWPVLTPALRERIRK